MIDMTQIRAVVDPEIAKAAIIRAGIEEFNRDLQTRRAELIRTATIEAESRWPRITVISSNDHKREAFIAGVLWEAGLPA